MDQYEHEQQRNRMAAIHAMSDAELIGASGPEHLDEATAGERDQLVNYRFVVDQFDHDFEEARYNGELGRARDLLDQWTERLTALESGLPPRQQANPRNPVVMLARWHREQIRSLRLELDDLR